MKECKGMECEHVRNLHMAFNEAMKKDGKYISFLQEIESDLVQLGMSDSPVVHKIRRAAREEYQV